MKEMLTENYCDGCDNVVHQVFDVEDFYNYKVGAIKCPICGTVIMPCNECDDNSNCDTCPWKSASISEAMSDEDHILWYRENSKEVYELMKKGDLGDGYKKLIEENNL